MTEDEINATLDAFMPYILLLDTKWSGGRSAIYFRGVTAGGTSSDWERWGHSEQPYTHLGGDLGELVWDWSHRWSPRDPVYPASPLSALLLGAWATPRPEESGVSSMLAVEGYLGIHDWKVWANRMRDRADEELWQDPDYDGDYLEFLWWNQNGFNNLWHYNEAVDEWNYYSGVNGWYHNVREEDFEPTYWDMLAPTFDYAEWGPHFRQMVQTSSQLDVIMLPEEDWWWWSRPRENPCWSRPRYLSVASFPSFPATFSPPTSITRRCGCTSNSPSTRRRAPCT